MADIDEIKALAQQIWPDAEHIDVAPDREAHRDEPTRCIPL